MKNIFGIILIVGVFACISLIPLAAQNNLSVSYQTAANVPDFLNICGDPDDVSVTIEVAGFEATERTNLTATLHLFEGTYLVNFNEASSSTGVTLIDNSDPHQPVFSLPNLSPTGLSNVQIAYSMAADCSALDTLISNNALQVFDTWEFNYDLGNQTNLTETDATPEYRDAFAIPSFTTTIESDFGPARVGDCFERTLVVNNSALDGFISEMYYSNLQGMGISVQNITINGVEIPFEKSLDFMGDTIVSAIITGDFFQNNTLGSNPGNGNNFFDPDETMLITEQICVVDCSDLQSFHNVSWGCNGDICQVVSRPDFVPIGEGAANVIVQDEGSMLNENTGYCSVGQTTVTFTNNGAEIHEGFAGMIDVETGIGLGSGFVLSSNGYTITGLQIAGVDVPNIGELNLLQNIPAFAGNPDGLGGLEDLDGDGFFDDLGLGESFEITAFYEFDCSLAQNTSLADNCTNDFAVSFNARVDYSNQCNQRLIRLQPNFFRPANNNANFENFTDPDAFAEMDTFYITHSESRTIRNFNIDCNGEEFFVASIALPQGVSPIISETQLFKNEITAVPLLDHSISNDTLYLTYDAASINFLLGDYDLVMAFTADCNAEVGASIFPLTFELVCPPCDCRHIWFCDNLTGPQIHATNPPCDEAMACDEGIQTTDFEVNRSTFGFTDNTYTTPINPDNANKKVGIACDLVQMTVSNVVGATAVSDNMGVAIQYQNVDGSDNLAETFLFENAFARITHNGATFTCPLTTNHLSIENSGLQKTLNFDLSSCLTESDLTLGTGDVVEFVGNFSINPNGPYLVQFRKIPELRGFGYVENNGEQIVCDSYGENFTVAKNTTVFDSPSSNNFPEGCEVTDLDYRLITVNNGFNDFFGDEFRRAVAIDSIRFNYDAAILDAFSEVSLEVSIPGHPIHGNSFFALSPLTDFPLGTYVAHFDTLVRTPSYNQVQSYAFNLRWRVTPSCRSLNGSSNGNNIYTISPTIFYKDRFYANFIGNGDCAEEKEESAQNNVSYSEPPTFSFTPFGVTNFLLSGDTATWTVQHCNNSFTADAGITWISVEDTTSSIFVVSMEDITDVTNPVDLDVQVYGDNSYFAFTPGLVRSNGQNVLEDICNVIRIKATVKNCGQTFFPVDAGWNCAPYEDDNWNPTDNPPCDEKNVQLSVTPLEPFLDANIIEQPITSPEICEDNTITILLRNTDLGTAFNVRSRLNLPQGTTLVPGSVEIAYPSNTAFQSAFSDPILVADNDAGKIYEYEDFSQLNAVLDENGLSGFNAGNPNSENELRLKFRFTTDCDFESGSLIFYNFQGLKGCGEASNFEAGETIPMVIAGTEADFSKLLHVEFTENSSLAPGGIGSVGVEITNLTTTPTDDTDFLTLTLPAGVTYVPNTTNPSVPDTWQPGEPSISIDEDGRQVLDWPLPSDLQQGENALLNFELNAPDLDCDTETVDVILRTFSTENLLCETTNETCEVITTTSTTGNTLTPLAANLGLLEFVISSVESACTNDAQEAVTVTGTLESLGAELENETITIHYHFDENGNGFYDEGEPEVASFDEIGTVLPNNPLTFSHTFDVNIEQVCMLLIRLDESAFSSLCGKVESLLDAPQLQNAGTDESFCVLSNVPTTFNLGVASCTNINYEFTWAAIPETAIDNLSDIKIPQPDLTITHEGEAPLELVYILQTSRPNCSVSFDTINITINEQPNIDAGFDQTICAGESTRLNAFVNGGATPYNVTWSPAVAADGNGLEPLVNPTETTDYIFTIIDNNNCQISDTVRVNVNNCDCIPPTITSVSTTASTCGNTEGTATINVDGNALDYSYTWSPDVGTAMGNVRTNLPFGGYVVTIAPNEDPNCMSTVNVLITNSDGPTATASTSPVTCDGTLGTVSLTPMEFNYIWPDGSTENTRNDLNPGSYFVTFTDPADEDCPNVLEAIIELNNALEAAVIVDTHPTCGESNGSVSINVTGGSGDYNFSWEGGENTQENLAGGIHAVTITDNGGACELEFLFVLTDDVPQANLDNIDISHVDCFNNENGSVTFDITTEEGFTPPSDTIFSNGLQIFENGSFPAGNICIVIMDGNNCVAGGTCFTILEPDPLQVNLNSTLSCENDGTINAQISGGTPPYLINWQDLIGNDNAFERTDLSAGTYNAIITDQNACSVSSTAIVQACNCESALITNIAITEAACTLSNGAATINVEGEESNYTYNWTPDIGMTNEFGNAKTNLPFGAYTVEIINIDNPTCSIEVSILITNEDAPMATAMVTPASCQQADGTAILSPSDYTYQWSDGMMGSGRMDLLAGVYTVTLTDPAAPDCPNVMEVIVPLSNPLAAELVVNTHPTCEQNNGSVTLNVTGGSGDYSYSWPSNTNTQDNIAAGIYTVTITDNNPLGCELPYIFILTDDVEEIETLNLTTTNVSCPGAADGSVDYALVFDPIATDTSDIIISNGIQIFENGSLPAGDFCLQISDNNDCIAGGICFTIESPEPLDIDLLLIPECETGGSIDVSVTGGTAPYSFDWLDLEGTNNPGDRTDLTVGDYAFVVTDALGCSLMSDGIQIDTCVVCDIFVDIDTLILQAPDCDTEAKLCFDLTPEEVGRYRITDNGEVYSDFLDRCEFDTLGVYTYATLLSVPGPYQLLSWEVNDTVFSGEFLDIPALVDSMNIWDPHGNWTLSDDGPFILGGFPSHTYDQMDVEVVSLGITSFLGYNLGFFPNGYAIPLELGPHEVIFTDTTTGCEEIIFVDVVCTNPDTILLTIVETMSDTLCFSGEELVGTIDTIYNDCPDDFFVTTEVLGDSCIIFTGITPGNSTACIVLCDEYEVCDTTYVLITIEELIDETVKDTIVIGQSVEYCFDIDSLDLPGELITIDNVCPELSNGTVDFDINEETFCVIYTGIELGTDTACIQLCDDLGNCDTIPFQITVVNGLVVVDTIFITVDTVTYCFDDIVDGTIISVEDSCPDNNGDEVIFTIDPLSNCIIYTGIAIGTDTACIWITNDIGDMSLVTFFVTVKETTTEYIRDTVFVNQTEIYCADTTELPGELVFIDNFCPEESGDFVDFFINPNTFCIEYTGLEIGTDSACVVFCDDLGYCDTAFITVTVVEFFDPPIATNDTTQTLRDTPVVIDVKSNDTIFGGLVGTPYILDAPLYGEAQFNLDCSITYTPEERYCERTDMFTYVICNPNGCDTATVFVFIECVGVVVFNAVSPNKDGFNDVFYVFGLDDKPDNTLEIYNRWGNLVYKTTNYQNDWAGTWDNNKDLPDGTYFYVLEYLDEEGNTVKLNGYLELYR